MEIAKDDNQGGYWDTGKKRIPFTEMDNNYLQNVYTRCLNKVLYFHNRASVFDLLAEQIENEAERRKLTLKEPETKFHENRTVGKKAKKSSGEDKIQSQSGDNQQSVGSVKPEGK